MSAKLWMATTKKLSATIKLYVETDDDVVRKDLGLPKSASLIDLGRTFKSQDDRNISNHFGLALGAFLLYSRYKNLDLQKVESADSIPEGLVGLPIGGSAQAFLIQVYEEI